MLQEGRPQCGRPFVFALSVDCRTKNRAPHTPPPDTPPDGDLQSHNIYCPQRRQVSQNIASFPQKTYRMLSPTEFRNNTMFPGHPTAPYPEQLFPAFLSSSIRCATSR